MYTIRTLLIGVKYGKSDQALFCQITQFHLLSTQHQVQLIRVEAPQKGQRLDNFLMRHLKGVPRSRVYRIIRRGEVRVNKKRTKPAYRLEIGDQVRIPPFTGSDEPVIPKPGAGLSRLLKESVLLEDDQLLIINKPAGLAVHGGSGVRLGLIEAIRQIDPAWQQAELAHRLDRDTSGCLVLCKNMSYLKEIQKQLKAKTVEKHYYALVHGQWPDHLQEVDAPLQKNVLSSGERMVRVDEDGKASRTGYRVLERFKGCSLVLAMPETGRTHQIRVHCQYAGHPIVGDPKYANNSRSAAGESRLAAVKNLCLHAFSIKFSSPADGAVISVQSAPHEQFAGLLESLGNSQ